jgi:hypothetical protein
MVHMATGRPQMKPEQWQAKTDSRSWYLGCYHRAPGAINHGAAPPLLLLLHEIRTPPYCLCQFGLGFPVTCSCECLTDTSQIYITSHTCLLSSRLFSWGHSHHCAACGNSSCVYRNVLDFISKLPFVGKLL